MTMSAFEKSKVLTQIPQIKGTDYRHYYRHFGRSGAHYIGALDARPLVRCRSRAFREIRALIRGIRVISCLFCLLSGTKPDSRARIGSSLEIAGSRLLTRKPRRPPTVLPLFTVPDARSLRGETLLGPLMKRQVHFTWARVDMIFGSIVINLATIQERWC